jgi:hypothetical protein
MSKTTFALLVVLLIFIGLLLYVLYGVKPTSIITTFSKPIGIEPTNPATATLSFATSEQNIRRGQTVTVAVLIHNPNPHPSVIQLEIGYDPNEVTIDSLMPGTFFTNPTVALNTIDPTTGRISYALHCPIDPLTNKSAECVSANSSTIAVITLSVNPYATSNTTTLSFFPKTVIRTSNGKDILQNTTALQLQLNSQLAPISSGSAVVQPQSNFIQATPAH